MSAPTTHNGFMVCGSGTRYLVGIGTITPISGVPTGARVRVRMRVDDFAIVFVRFAGAVTQHVLCLDSCSELALGPEIARNVSPAPVRVS